MGKNPGFMGHSSDIAGNSHKVVKENEYEEEDFSRLAIWQLKDSDKKYKQIDEYSQKKAKKWLEKYVDSLSGISPKMILNCRYTYKRTYKNAIKTTQSILHQKIGNTYEIFHGEWLNFEDFKATNTIERLWKKVVEYARTYTENNNLSISTETKKSICYDFTKCLNALILFIEKYDTFFHHLVYHMRYKEHISIPDKIGQPETMRKNEIVVKQPIIPNITKAVRLALTIF
ncbi:17075_t:CDS:2 [Dentiscutata heterogama]|uniref:17075_t:CDS:1 n=1 Tax=Dentiscutata heterogama TaxID=1316150 RepID=A0ACA9M4Y6_9GLOM|nr:17075_t:CDS:2 [Dentiscutata heterogama]